MATSTDCRNCQHSSKNHRNNNGKCDYSCHPRTCQCGSCHHGQKGQCENPNHEYWCHCGYKKNQPNRWDGIAE